MNMKKSNEKFSFNNENIKDVLNNKNSLNKWKISWKKYAIVSTHFPFLAPEKRNTILISSHIRSFVKHLYQKMMKINFVRKSKQLSIKSIKNPR